MAVALALGTFMQVLDSTIANVSLPTIAGNLGASTDDATWVITAFAAANGVTVPLTGWLMGRYGVVRTFVVSVALFTIASFLCGIATSLPMLVVFRLLQGGVSGPMIPGTQALLISIFPPEKRALALGIWSITTLVGPIAGPILGGYISDNYHWGLVFLINVPVGVVCTLVVWRGLRSRETPTRKLPIDTVGLILLAIWVGALQVRARPRQERRLVQLQGHRRPDGDRRHRLRRLADLGADRRPPRRRSQPVPQPQLRARDGGLLPGLRPVLRQQPAPAPVAAAAAGLHRDLGGAGLRAQRGGGDPADARS